MGQFIGVTGSGEVLQISPANGALSSIGSIVQDIDPGFNTTNGLGLNDVTRTLFVPYGELLASYSLETGSVTTQNVGRRLTCLAVDSDTGVIFGFDADEDEIVRRVPGGSFTTFLSLVGSTSTNVVGLARDPSTNRLFATTGDRLYTIDGSNPGILAEVIQDGFTAGLTWDTTTGTLMGIGGGVLSSLDGNPGEVIPVALFGAGFVVGLSHDAAISEYYVLRNTFFLGNSRTDLLTMSEDVSRFKYLGSVNATLRDLAFDPASRILYSIRGSSSDIVSVDVSSLDEAFVRPSQGAESIEWDSAEGGFFARNGVDVFRFPLSGGSTSIGAFPSAVQTYGLGWVPPSGRLYSYGESGLVLSPSQLNALPLGGAGVVVGDSGIDSSEWRLTYNANQQELIATNGFDLLRLSESTGLSLTKGRFAGECLARNSELEQTYTVLERRLTLLDESGNAGSFVGPLISPGIGEVVGLACDVASGMVYAIDVSGTLFRVDPSTGAGTAVGLTLPDIRGLAFQPGVGGQGILFGVSSDQIYELDPESAVASPIGSPSEFGCLEGLAFDVQTETLFGTDLDQGLVRFDTATGQGTLIGSTGFRLISLCPTAPLP